MEITEGSNGRNDIARLETEKIARPHAWVAVLSWWRRRDANVKAQRALSFQVARDRVIIPAGTSKRVARDKIEDMLVIPDRSEGLR